MGVQFGTWEFAASPSKRRDLMRVREHLASYGTDGESGYHREGIDILYYGMHETEESRREEQPYFVSAGQILTWDGRLDNRTELIREFSETLPASAPDVVLVAAAYDRWGFGSLPKLIGDWALSVWDRAKQELILARDFLGTRSLFYTVDNNRAQWCTTLDPLVLFAGHSFSLNREYLAGWFGLFPALHLTPYVGIHSVPPASYVLIRQGSVHVREFWQFRSKLLTYRNDADYEEHFTGLFEQSLRRRLRSSLPVLAELSGGMDSSSIVCMADQILKKHSSLAPRLETISYYSPSEPNWDELPYVSKVEEQRGRKGFHLEVRTDDVFSADFAPDHFMSTPGSLCPVGQSDLEFRHILKEGGYRVLLSGIGGDEVLGGVPTPLPLLADLLVRGRWKALATSLFAWALALRRPLISVLFETAAMFLYEGNPSRSVGPPAWLSPSFRKANAKALRGYPQRMRFFGPRPSFQENLNTLEAVRRQLSCYPLPTKPTYRKLYPYLDRDLMEFLFSIPQDQLFRPQQRRSLMRRAVSGIVPQELLNRKRKAFVIRGPLMAISSEFETLEARARDMLSSSLNIVMPPALVAALQEARAGGRAAVTPIVRVFAIERWFQNMARWSVLRDLDPYASADPGVPPEPSLEQHAEQFS
jgi:asparagine synthase (glutamine-hydrolysing)